MAKRVDKKLIEEWEALGKSISNSTPIDIHDSFAVITARRSKLEKSPTEWFKYYFPNYCLAEFTDWHIRSIMRVMNNPEWYVVRSWSRELAKSAITMMEVLYLTLTGKKRNILLASNSEDNAIRLLAPYKLQLESNNRLIQDYGIQQTVGKWESAEFVTKNRVAFRAIGAGQSPRGTRNEEVRPDAIIIDDFDTDEECRNPDIIKKKVDWVEKALIGTRSVSNPLLIIVNGNIISKYCAVTELAKRADKHEIVNIIDKDGKSTWPSKNSQEHIDRIQKQISYNSFQQEYMNNPEVEGTTFKKIIWGKVPKLSTCDQVVIYADPSPSNSGSKKSSQKSVAIVARKGFIYYIYKIWTDNVTNAVFIDWLFEAKDLVTKQGVDFQKMYIENNTLQDPFYQQVLLPIIREKERLVGIRLGLIEDKDKKKDKFARIDARLEPKNRNGELIFNQDEQKNPHMERATGQFLSASPDSKILDAPDAVEGAVGKMEKNKNNNTQSYRTGKRTSFRE